MTGIVSRSITVVVSDASLSSSDAFPVSHDSTQSSDLPVERRVYLVRTTSWSQGLEQRSGETRLRMVLIALSDRQGSTESWPVVFEGDSKEQTTIGFVVFHCLFEGQGRSSTSASGALDSNFNTAALVVGTNFGITGACTCVGSAPGAATKHSFLPCPKSARRILDSTLPKTKHSSIQEEKSFLTRKTCFALTFISPGCFGTMINIPEHAMRTCGVLSKTEEQRTVHQPSTRIDPRDEGCQDLCLTLDASHVASCWVRQASRLCTSPRVESLLATKHRLT